MTSTLSCAHKSSYVWCFPLALQINQPTEGHCCPTSYLSFSIPISTRHAFIPFRYSQHPTLDPLPLIFTVSSHPACFYIPWAPLLRPSLHLSTHCVMSLLCKSEQFVWQPKCNATPLTWESQQSVVLVRETFLEAAVLSLSESKWALWQSWKPKRELWSTCVYISQLKYSVHLGTCIWFSLDENAF